MEFGLLLLRAVVGLGLMAHGAQKLFGTFGGGGIRGTGAFFGQLGFRQANAFAALAGLGEFVGGLLLTLGLFTPFASAMILAVMLVATMTVHIDKGFFGANGGYELPMTLAAVAISLAFMGPGQVSLDWALGLLWNGTFWGILAVALGVLGAAVPLSMRAMATKRGGVTP